MDKQFCEVSHNIDRQFRCLENEVQKGFSGVAERELKEENRRLREELNNFQYKTTTHDLNNIQNNVNKILCGLGKVAPGDVTPSVLSGCC